MTAPTPPGYQDGAERGLVTGFLPGDVEAFPEGQVNVFVPGKTKAAWDQFW